MRLCVAGICWLDSKITRVLMKSSGNVNNGSRNRWLQLVMSQISCVLLYCYVHSAWKWWRLGHLTHAAVAPWASGRLSRLNQTRKMEKSLLAWRACQIWRVKKLLRYLSLSLFFCPDATQLKCNVREWREGPPENHTADSFKTHL